MNVSTNEPLVLCSHFLVDSPSSEGRSKRDADLVMKAPYEHVVVCVDGSELGKGAVSHAEIIAGALGARLTFVHVLESGKGVSDAPQDLLDWTIRRREARDFLKGLATQAKVPDSGPRIRSELLQGSAAEQICRWTEQHGVDLTVLCSHGARGVTDWCLAGTARKLIERVHGSVLLVPASAASRGAPLRYKRLLVPLDGSPRAESVLPIAMRIAASQDAEVVLAHVVPAPEITQTGVGDAEGVELGRRVTLHNERVATDYLNRIRARISQPGSRVRTVVAGDGNVRTGLDRLIEEERADLVVMSAHGRTGRTETPFGSVAEYVLTHANVPLLVVRGRGRQRMRRVGLPVSRNYDRFGPSADEQL